MLIVKTTSLKLMPKGIYLLFRCVDINMVHVDAIIKDIPSCVGEQKPTPIGSKKQIWLPIFLMPYDGTYGWQFYAIIPIT